MKRLFSLATLLSLILSLAFSVEAAPKKGKKPSKPANAPMPKFVKEGFKVELIYTVPKSSQGSWVSLASDDKGRLYACDQKNAGLYRITPPAIGQKGPAKVEKINVPVTAAQGLLWAFDSLYALTYGEGVKRVTDTNGDDVLDKAETLIPMKGRGEHGPHAMVLGPEGKWIYFISGNYTALPKHQHSLAPKLWKEDQLLPRILDPRHARDIRAPGGWICRMKPDGKYTEVVAMGFRNPYDMAFNVDGELFAYDADMEWDTGSPWYRPTRVSHVTSGSESGWRTGAGKFPAYYVDTLPAAIDIGPGSPTGVASGRGTKFPTKYQKAIFINDWTFGTMYAIHTEAKGSSYTATKEEIVAGKPLPLTDSAVSPKDGALYFAVGGRGGQSAVYRLVYTGNESTAAPKPDTKFAAKRALRKKLEAFHTKEGIKQADAIETSWAYLNHEDRFIRFAARTAIEHQPADSWRKKALNEKNEISKLHACLALARAGEKSDGPSITKALLTINMSALDIYHQKALIRSFAVNFARNGPPSIFDKSQLVSKLDPLFPSADDALNRELAMMLSYLQSPTLAAKVIPLLAQKTDKKIEMDAKLVARNDRYGKALKAVNSTQPELQQIQYAYVLKNLKAGWNESLRTRYFQWFNLAKQFKGGNSFAKFQDFIRKEALASIADKSERDRMSKLKEVLKVAKVLPRAKGPGKQWSVSEIEALSGKMTSGRNFERGKKMYAAAMCAQCHMLAGEGGMGGPDLTQLAGRYSIKDMAEHILKPNLIISDQYHNLEFTKKDGSVVVGRIVDEKDGKVYISPTPMSPDFKIEVTKADIVSKKPSKISPMMPGLLYPLNEKELLDLFAYLRSAGNPKDPAFK